jgi:membrane fusion protein, multidrug efflux system
MEKKKSVFRRIILPILVILLLVFLAVRQLGKNKAEKDASASITAKKMTIFPVTVANPQMDTITQDFELNGTFNADHNLNFLSEVSGRIQRLNVENGDYVSQGKVIAQLDAQQTAIDLRLAREKLAKAKSDLDKYETMLASNAVNKQQVEDARLNLRNAESSVATLQRSMGLSSVKAPISGYIYNLQVEQGSYLAPGTPIADIVDIKTLKMSVKLLDNQVVRVKNGQKVNIEPDLYPNTRIDGKVTSIAPQADGSRKFDTEIKFSNPSKTPLKSGMTGKVKFEFGGSKEALTIPVKCIVGSLQKPQVYIVDGNKAKLISIEIGVVGDNMVEVTSGLSTQNQVIQTGQLNISNGSLINIVQ